MKRVFLFFLIPVLVIISPTTFSRPDAAFKIVLDAGHGGKDPGNLGTGRYKETEKQVALAVTLKVGEYIEENLTDVEVVYTRKGDTYPTLWQRVNIANGAKADLFISIHCDAFTNSNAYGCGSYVMGLDYTDENLRMAQKENSSIFLEEDYEKNYDGFDPNSIESVIALTLNQSVYMDKSIQVAQKIQEQFRTRVNRKDRGVRQAPYLVTSRTLMPSVLVELGFLTNHSEEDFLHSKNGQTYMASAIYRAVKEYTIEQQQNKATSIVEQLDKEEIKKAENTQKEVTDKESSFSKSVVYKIQIHTSAQKENLLDIEGNFVSFFQEGNLYKFTIGNETTIEAARMLQTLAKNNNYKDAFVIAFYKGEKISLQEARELTIRK
tara:strand:- start:131 stop:1267 length:1137 start_codon:yes stop_codon:yes gene_type:complete